jgi:hypothetical protein
LNKQDEQTRGTLATLAAGEEEGGSDGACGTGGAQPQPEAFAESGAGPPRRANGQPNSLEEGKGDDAGSPLGAKRRPLGAERRGEAEDEARAAAGAPADPAERTLARRRLVDAFGFKGAANAEAWLNAEIRRHGWQRLLFALERWRERLPSIRTKAGKAATFRGILEDLELHGIDGPGASQPPPRTTCDLLGGPRRGVHDTSEPFETYKERMVREGKFKLH